jgi:hypothetical protein
MGRSRIRVWGRKVDDRVILAGVLILGCAGLYVCLGHPTWMASRSGAFRGKHWQDNLLGIAVCTAWIAWSGWALVDDFRTGRVRGSKRLTITVSSRPVCVASLRGKGRAAIEFSVQVPHAISGSVVMAVELLVRDCAVKIQEITFSPSFVESTASFNVGGTREWAADLRVVLKQGELQEPLSATLRWTSRHQIDGES